MSEKSKWVQELQNKATRDAFVSSQMSIPLAFQILALREHRGMTQKQLAEKAGMLQPRIAAMERPSGGEPNLRTLKRLASAFDVALIIRFAPFSELIKWTEGFSPDSFAVPSFSDDLALSEPETVSEREIKSAAIPTPLQEKVSGADRQKFWQQQEKPEDILSIPGHNNVIQFPIDRISRSPREAVSNATISYIAS
jgi:transcriptional regulator with XRE-family HTH domain